MRKFIPVIITVIVIFLLGTMVTVFATHDAGKPHIISSVKKITKAPIYKDDGSDWGAILFSDNGKKAAWIKKENGKDDVYINGEKIATYDRVDISLWNFSPDGSGLAYWAENMGERFVVINKEEGKHYQTDPNNPFAGLHFTDLIWSPDSKKLVYSVLISIIDDGVHPVQINDMRLVERENGEEKEGPQYTHIGNISFSPDGKKLAFGAADVNSNSKLIIRGRTSSEEQLEESTIDTATLRWDKDNTILHIKYEYVNGKMAVIFHDKQTNFFDGLGPSQNTINASGTQALVYVYPPHKSSEYQAPGKAILIHKDIGAIESDWYDEIYAGGVSTWSPNGEAVVLPAKKGDQWVVLVGTRNGFIESKPYKKISNAVMSSNNKNVAFTVTEIEQNEKGEGREYVVVAKIKENNIKEVWRSKSYVQINWLIYTNGSYHYHTGRVPWPMFFTKDSKKIIFQAFDNDGARVVIGDREGKTYSEIWGPVLSKNGKTVSYGAVNSKDVMWITEKVK